MTIANVEMAKAWDGDEGDHWTDQAHRYDAAGKALAARLMEAAAIRSAERVLDIGCGAGHSSLSAARQATDGSVLGVDLSSRMLKLARQRAKEEGLDNVEFIQADAQVHPFEAASFDVALSSFGSMFFNDPVAAFGNVAAALKPGGRLVLLTWQAIDDNEWIVAMRGALAMGRDLPKPPPTAPSPFSLADPDRVRSILGPAGFRDIELWSVHEPLVYGGDAEEAFSFVRSMGIVKGLTESLDEADRTTALEQLHQLLVDHAGPDGVTLPTATWIITASR